jgi:hypothetical protein
MFVTLLVIVFAPMAWERLPDASTPIPDPGPAPTSVPPRPDPPDSEPVPAGTPQPPLDITPGARPAIGDGGTYEYLPQLFSDGPPYISTCAPVEFTIRSGVGPTNGAAMVLRAVQQLSNATGIPFRWVGFTDTPYDFNQRPTQYPFEAKRIPFWIGWSPPGEVPDFGANSDVLGVGGPVVIEDKGRREIITGGVVLRSDSDAAPVFGKGVTWGNIIQHELGHAVGLGHIDSPVDLMDPSADPETPDGYGPGDLRGLDGIETGCGS